MILLLIALMVLTLVDGMSVTNKSIGLGSTSNIVTKSYSETRFTFGRPLNSVPDDDYMFDNNHRSHEGIESNLHTIPNSPWGGQVFYTSRRQSLDISTRGGLLGLLTVMGFMSGSVPQNALASVDGTASATSTGRDILSRLAGIPTFCIVDGNTGVPYMIFDGQAPIATGYFFLSLQVALGVLQDARDKDPNGKDVWEAARITVVPLSVAVQMTLSKKQRTAVNGGSSEGTQFDTFADIIPSEEGVADAKAIAKGLGQNPDKWSQKGRVPLFYMDGLTLPPSSKFAGMEPRYFNVHDLVQEWKNQNPGSTTQPPILAVECIGLFRSAVIKNDWSALANVAIMPVQESNQAAVELMKAQRDSSSGLTIPYNFDKVFLVGSSKKK